MAGVVVNYKGTAISNLTNTATKSLKTQGRYCEADISVAYTAPVLEVLSAFGASAFKSCPGITELRGYECSGGLGNYCFQSCANLTAISGFNKITSTGSSCFQDCTNLVTVSGFNGLTTIADRLFNGCTKLETVEGFNSLQTLTDYAFYNCSKLRSVSGFAELKNIGTQTFYNCTSLTTLPSTCTIESMGVQAFRSCTALTTFNVPTNVTSLANQIFYGCTALTDLVIHGTVNNFGPGSGNNSMTNGCTNLTHVTLPGGSYGSYVLCNNKNIETITVGALGNPVTSINANAFWGCNGRQCAFTVYTEGAQEISHNASNYWGNNISGTTCTFKDSNGVAPDYTIGF